MDPAIRSAVLRALAVHKNAYVPIQQIAQEASLSEDVVKDHIDVLAQEGLVQYPSGMGAGKDDARITSRGSVEAAAAAPCPAVIPGTYNGRATINGRPAPDGTEVVAEVAAIEWSRAVIAGGHYVMDVPDHLPTYPPCFEGGPVAFRSGTLWALERPIWRSGLQGMDLTFKGRSAERGESWDSSRAYAAVQALQALAMPVAGTAKHATPEDMTVRPLFRGRDFAVDESLCFVLMPFSKELAALYQNQIRAAVESQGLACMRADELFSPGPIMEQIWEQMNRAGLIIADLTGKNPNVFYELGVAHTLGKPVILIAQSEEDVPFDLRHLRFIRYQATLRGCRQLEDNLKRAIRSALVA